MREELPDSVHKCNKQICCFDYFNYYLRKSEEPLWERAGFKRFLDAVLRDGVRILIIASPRCLSHSSMQMAQLQALAKSYDLQFYSPLTGLMELS